MTTAEPPHLPGSPGGGSGGKLLTEGKVSIVKKLDQSWRKESKEESSVVSEEVSGEASKLKSGDAKTDGREEEVSDEVSETWAQVPQGKFGCSQPSTPKQIGNEIQISASKYIVLSTNE
uniref:Uncharacterized protein n=1 Tax=Brassica oleracea TaxID=3712 RepID=A0A3P6G711_BRAOL|nr:unnamed protein product [Brassica oleracea]